MVDTVKVPASLFSLLLLLLSGVSSDTSPGVYLECKSCHCTSCSRPHSFPSKTKLSVDLLSTDLKHHQHSYMFRKQKTFKPFKLNNNTSSTSILRTERNSDDPASPVRYGSSRSSCWTQT